MQTVKRIGLGTLALLALLLMISFLLPSKVVVTRSATIKAPVMEVFNQVNTLQNWEKWSPWHKIDPKMLLSYEGPDAGEGARYNWFSEHPQVGNGSLTIVKSTPFERIDTKMQFEGENDGMSYYLFKEKSGGTEVTWVMEADMGYNPVGRYLGLMFDDMLGPDFERGLQNLKGIVEQPATASNL